MRAPAVALTIAFAAAAVAAGCTAGGSAEGTAPPGGRGGGRGQAVPITAAKAVQKTVPLDLRAIGTVEPSSNVAIRAQITGELTAVSFKEGDEVREGQELFTLDRRPLEATLKQAEANLERDVAQASNAAAQAQRVRDLAQRGIATREQVGTATATAEATDATVGADRAAIESARVQLQFATIRAPISGRTGALMVHPGNLVRANDTTPLVVINQLSPINVSFAIPEAQLPDLKRYLARGDVRVDVQPPNDDDPPSRGRITFVDNAVDQTTGTIRIKGSFANGDHRLWPGQYVNVVITLATDQGAIVVPSAAVQAGQQGNYVFVVKDDHTVDLRAVEVGRTNGSETVVAKGIAQGETVVTDGHLRLVPGSRVSIKSDAEGGRGQVAP